MKGTLITFKLRIQQPLLGAFDFFASPVYVYHNVYNLFFYTSSRMNEKLQTIFVKYWFSYCCIKKSLFLRYILTNKHFLCWLYYIYNQHTKILLYFCLIDLHFLINMLCFNVTCYLKIIMLRGISLRYL